MGEHMDSDFEMQQLEKLLKKLFDHWNLTPSERFEILGYEAPLMCQELRSETASLLAGSDSVERALLLLSIHARLRTVFSRNLELAYSWMRAENQAFQGKRPIEVACNQGISGLMKIMRYLDRAAGC